jgi:hypothetical protein
VLALSDRRGNAAAAALLYAETPQSVVTREAWLAARRAERDSAPRFAGRPTKRDRRHLEDFLAERGGRGVTRETSATTRAGASAGDSTAGRPASAEPCVGEVDQQLGLAVALPSEPQHQRHHDDADRVRDDAPREQASRGHD